MTIPATIPVPITAAMPFPTPLTEPLDLFEASERAYQMARRVVFNSLAPGQVIDPAELSDYQREVLRELTRAEDRVAAYRCAAHGS